MRIFKSRCDFLCKDIISIVYTSHLYAILLVSPCTKTRVLAVLNIIVYMVLFLEFSYYFVLRLYELFLDLIINQEGRIRLVVPN